VRFVFIGGTRFIGHHAAARAIARGHEVVVLHRGAHRCEVEGVAEVIVERRDPSALALEIARARPDVVVDTFAMTRADGQTLAMIARIASARLIVLSSQDVYAAWGAVISELPPVHGVVDEDSPLTPIARPYAGKGHDGGEDYDKKDVEAEVRGLPVPTCVLRLPMVYGPRDYRRRFGDVVDAIDLDRAVTVPGGATWRAPHADVRDVAHAIVLAAEASRAPLAIYNVVEAATPTMGERVRAIANAIGKPVTWGATGETYPDLVVDSSRIRRDLGFAELTTAEERVRDLIATCRATRVRVA
jgi:nucleoside-diphosphate-sugar epimerase